NSELEKMRRCARLNRVVRPSRSFSGPNYGLTRKTTNKWSMIRRSNGKESHAPDIDQGFRPPGRAHEVVEGRNGFEIRSYRDRDRGEIQRLCCDTGFLGEPIDAVFQDRELFAELFTKPYLDHEPEWAWVAEDQGRVVGYLLGSVGKEFELALLRSGFQTTFKMVFRLAMGRYARHPRSGQFI